MADIVNKVYFRGLKMTIYNKKEKEKMIEVTKCLGWPAISFVYKFSPLT